MAQPMRGRLATRAASMAGCGRTNPPDPYGTSSPNADNYTSDNRIIGNTLMAQARAHSAKVDADLDAAPSTR